MPTPDYTAELEALGYEVGEAMPGVLFVRGYGVASYFTLEDTDALESMVAPDLHEQRVLAYAETLISEQPTTGDDTP